MLPGSSLRLVMRSPVKPAAPGLPPPRSARHGEVQSSALEAKGMIAAARCLRARADEN